MTPKFTLVHPYYNHANTLPVHLKHWNSWSNEQKENVEIIIVDDCSLDNPLDISKLNLDLNIKAYRILDDILWNTSGVKNLGFKESSAPWVIAADFDMVVMQQTLLGLWNLTYKDKHVMYWPYLSFPSEKRPERTRAPHCNSYVMNKELYWQTGGYDEDFSGQWGWEDIHFHTVILPHFNVVKTELPDVKFLWLRSFVHSSNVPRGNDSKNYKKFRNKKKAASKNEPYRSEKIFRFKWERIK